MSVFAKGVIATVCVMGALYGMVFLLMSMVMGAKLAYWVEGAVVFGVLSIMSAIWVFSALGPVGPDTAWQAIAAGPAVTSASYQGTSYNVSDYPNGQWQAPKQGAHLADLSGADDLVTEQTEVKTVMDAMVGNAISPIPGVVAKVKPIIQGDIGLTPGAFTETDIRMEQAVVKGKQSLIAIGRAVPSEPVSQPALPGGVQTATIQKYLVNVGDTITKGEPVVQTDAGPLTSNDIGIVAALGPDVGSLVRPNVPFLILDIENNPANTVKPVNVVAVRVRGSLKTPPTIYLLVSLVLFFFHLIGLSRVEKARKREMQPA